MAAPKPGLMPARTPPQARRSRTRRPRGNMLLGVVIGFAIGVAVAGLIAFALTKSSNPFDGKSGRIVDPSAPNVAGSDRESSRSGEPKFDFSKILPGVESRRSQESLGDKTSVASPAAAGAAPATPATSAAAAAAAAAVAEKSGKFYLQAGAYQNAADAEDQRAKLALMGIEASLQTASIPDKGTLNRVRLGPFSSAEEMNQVKSELLKRGVATAVIKAP